MLIESVLCYRILNSICEKFNDELQSFISDTIKYNIIELNVMAIEFYAMF